MANLNGFDATQVDPQAPREVIPAGWYTARMTASEMKPTSNNLGLYLQCTFQLIGGAHPEFTLVDRLNLNNPNPTATEIAYRTLSAICHAVGILKPQDSQQLHNRPLQIQVSLRPAGPGNDGKFYEASNEIRGYKAVEGATGAGSGGAPAWATQAQPAPPVAPAWQPPAPPVAAAQPAWQQPTAPEQGQPAPVAAPVNHVAPPVAAWQQPVPEPMPAPQWQPPVAPEPAPVAAPPWQQPAPAADPNGTVAAQPIDPNTPPWAR